MGKLSGTTGTWRCGTLVLLWWGVLATQIAGASDGDAGFPKLDERSCAALRAPGAAAKFSLGAQACPSVAAGGALRTGPMPRSEHAQHLHLFGPAAADELPAETVLAPAAKPAAPKARPASRTSARSQRISPALARAMWLAPDIDRVAAAYRIDPLLLHAIARVESGHNPQAVSHAGARGVMQVMPATGQRFGAEDPSSLHHAPTNLEVSARYLVTLGRLFPGDLRLVLAAYNAGEGAVLRYGRRVPPFAETQAYVVKVLAEYSRLRQAAAAVRAAALTAAAVEEGT